MNNTIVASAIIGVSMIFSGLIMSDNISFKDQHVIPLAGGAVKLGDIYKEEKLISAKLIFKQGEQVLVSQGNPDDFNSEVDDKIAEIKQAYALYAVPRYVIISKEGKIIDANLDAPSTGKVEEKLRVLLN